MRLSSISTVYSKEMLDMVRDRRTMMTMVLVPIAVIPVLLQVMSLFTRSSREKAEEEAMVVAARPGAADPAVLATLRG
ncbi:MAG: hypothetical protein ACRD8O_19985, partial [Bryobacteraceae bacterium]